MESIKIEVVPIPHSPDFKIRYVVNTVIESIRLVDGVWWVHFSGSRESMAFGTDDKPFTGTKPIRITFEEVDAEPSKPSV